jgi:hypothetical protein
MTPSLRDLSKPATSIVIGQAISQGVKKLNPPKRRAATTTQAKASIPIKASTMMMSSE